MSYNKKPFDMTYLLNRSDSPTWHKTPSPTKGSIHGTLLDIEDCINGTNRYFHYEGGISIDQEELTIDWLCIPTDMNNSLVAEEVMISLFYDITDQVLIESSALSVFYTTGDYWYRYDGNKFTMGLYGSKASKLFN